MVDHSIRPHDQVVPVSETYADHFGLRVEAFSAAADAISFYRSASYAEALATLHLGVRSRRGLVLLVGDAGTGKTTVARHLCEELQSPFCVSYVSNNRYPFPELLQRAALGFGIDPLDEDGPLDLQARLAAVLHEQAVDGMAFVLVIDEAQDLDDDALQRLRLLSNDEAGAVPLQIVLVGQRALARRLVRPHLRAVANRVTSRSVVGRLSRQESIRYVGARLECAGGKASIFSDPALQLIARRCGGNPRTISVVCHTAMLLASSEGASRVSKAMVASALRARLAPSGVVGGWSSRVSDAIGLQEGPAWATGASLVAAGAVVILAVRGFGPSAGMAPPSGREMLVETLVDVPAEAGASVDPLGSGDDLQQDTALAVGTPADPPMSEAPPAAAAFDPGTAPASPTDSGRVVNVPDGRPAGGPLVPATFADVPDAAVRVTPVRAANLREEPAPRSGRPRAVPQQIDADGDRTGADSPGVREIRVRPGRGLRAMAREVYGDDSPAVIARLKRANPQITDVNLIRAGDLLRFPDLTGNR